MPLPALEGLPEIPDPMELFELVDGASYEIVPVKWELGWTHIRPRDGREPRDVHCLRLHVDPATKGTIPAYWDITSKHLVSELLGYLQAHPPGSYKFSITKHGRGPTARFTLRAEPVGS